MGKDVFISYSTNDQKAKNELVELFDKNDISYFLDANDLELGKDIEQSLKENLKKTRFTILIVTKNSLLSAWVGMETMFRLQQENFYKKNTLICVMADEKFDVFDRKSPIILKRELKAQRDELEELRKELKDLGEKTEVYDIEINRIDNISISDVMIKVRNHLGAVLNDPDRKENDLEKLINTIKENQSTSEEKVSPSTKESSETPEKITVEYLRNLANQGEVQKLLDTLDILFDKNPHFSYAQTKQNLQFALGQGGIHPNQMQGLLVFLGSNEVKKRLAQE